MNSFRIVALGGLTSALVIAACSGGSTQTNEDTVDSGLDASQGTPLDAGADVIVVGPTGQASVGVNTASTAVSVQIGGMATLAITLKRTIFNGALTATVTGLPAGVTVAPVTIAAGATTATITYAAAANATIGKTTTTLHVDGAGGAISSTANVALDVRGLPGTLDTSFGTMGIVTAADLGTTAGGVALQSTGGIIVTSSILDPVTGMTNGDKDLITARFTADGKPDLTFGTAGKHVLVTGTPSDPTVYQLQGIPLVTAAADDSLVVLPNAAHGNMFISAHTPAYHLSKQGVFDSMWGDGTGFSDLATITTASAMHGANILIVGYAGLGTGKSAAQRFPAATGLPDGFGGSYYASSYQFNAVAPLPNGGMYACGDDEAFNYQDGGVVSGTAFVVKTSATGTLDTTFGSNGALTNLGIDHCKGVVTTKQGDVVMLGEVSSHMILLHATSAGIDGSYRYPTMPSPTFSSMGATAIALGLQDDRPILLGAGKNAIAPMVLLARTNFDGSLDATFGSGGYVDTTLGATTAAGAVPVAMALQADGKVVVVGSLDGALMIARFWL